MYKKLVETKIVRTQHEVTFRLNSSTAFSIIEDLKMVPQKAKLIDNDEDDDERILVFEEDRKA
jgi:hypothetical protein